MDVGFFLAAIAQYPQPAAVGPQPPHKLKADAVGRPRPDHVAEAEAKATHPKQIAIRRNESLTAELACAVGGDRPHRRIVLCDHDLASVAVDPAAGCIENAAHLSTAHRFEHVVREQRSFAEIYIR